MYSWHFSKKNSSPQKWGPFEFSNFCQKMQKHKSASISLTVRDRAILSKFSTHRVPKQCTNGDFQKIFLSPKMEAILNFQILAKMEKHKIASISVTMRDGAILSKFLTISSCNLTFYTLFYLILSTDNCRELFIVFLVPRKQIMRGGRVGLSL